LRNTSLVNSADGCALSLPMHAPGTAPAGLLIAGGSGDDRRVLAIGATVEAVLRPLTSAA
jgi:aspartyl-tRNA(Asn)/glutamyl-tRNA(Gln) amidotransferase subunit A